MKKIFYSTLLLLAAGWAFVACSEDEGDDASYSYALTPERDAAGTYVGTFSRIQENDANAETETADGTLTIEATDTAYVAVVVFTSEAFSLNDTLPTNITHANDRYTLTNFTADNPLGAIMTGAISGQEVVTCAFQKKQRTGRRTVTYNYSFEGKKQ